MGLAEALFLSAVTGAASAVATVVALKVDIKWIREILKDYGERIKTLETKVQ
ncbi:hypothetical protein [Vibrio hangzhouensis]|uniref:Uncharacterized protein n=1 Tax=Vibrio hangzhouensis TaxID=462991 RepID=A0A1H5WGB1_9VIBR|nr:hypothetical protein [Vibrio hangzhouensis]SEF98380.1 hypothetical protein SAMN04488244_105257 [Vibrio hangzhouensis]